MEEGRALMKSSSFSKVIGVLVAATFSSNALAEYYVVYSNTQIVSPPPPPVVYYQKTTCTPTKHKKTHKRYYKTVKVAKKKSSAVVSVYYVFNNCNGWQQCGNCNNCQTVMMPVSQGCGSTVFYGQTPLRHSDSYYMQGCDDGYCDPDIDGNTYDNDIY
jgi:hypothetical protein